MFTEPVLQSSLSEVVDETTEDTITLEYTESRSGTFDHYRFEINGTDTSTVIKKRSDTNRHVKFSDLVAGNSYRVTARTVSGREQSQPLFITISTRKLLHCHTC